MIEIINPKEISNYQQIIADLKRFGLDHQNLKIDLGWNYILDQVWLVRQLEEYNDSNDIYNPIVLDVGCGRSLFHNFIEDRFKMDVWGIDRPYGYCHQELHRNVDFLQDFMEFNGFKTSSVDVIYWLSSIEHNQLHEIKSLYEKSIELLKPGGLLLITFPIARETGWFEQSQQTNLSIQDALEIFDEGYVVGEFDEIRNIYKANTLNLKDKYSLRYGDFDSGSPAFIVAGVKKLVTKVNNRPNTSLSSNLNGPFVFVPFNDTHVHWMLPIAKELEPVYFVTSPSHQSENSELRLRENNIPFSQYSPGLIYKIKPRAIILGNDWGPQGVLDEAKYMKVPTICIQEGVLDFVSGDSQRMRNADFAFFQGEIMKNYLKRPKVIVTGNPKYDELSELPIPNESVIMVNCNFTYGIFEEIRDQWIGDVAYACKDLNVKFFISQHPRDNGVFSPEIEVINSNAFLIKDQLARCNVLITRFSTLIYEAVATGREVIYFNPHKENFGLLANDPTGTIIYATDRESLIEAIKKAISRQKAIGEKSYRSVFLKAHIGTTDHNSAKICQENIKKITENNWLDFNHIYNLFIKQLEINDELMHEISRINNAKEIQALLKLRHFRKSILSKLRKVPIRN